MPSCGPADGPAFDVIISENRLRCAYPRRSPAPGQTYLRIWVLGEDEPEMPSTLEVGTGGSVYEGVAAEHCVKDDTCMNATDGSVGFGILSRGAESVSYDLMFEDGSNRSGVVRFERCERRFPCG